MAEPLGTLEICLFSRIIIIVFEPFLIYPATVKTHIEVNIKVIYIETASSDAQKGV